MGACVSGCSSLLLLLRGELSLQGQLPGPQAVTAFPAAGSPGLPRELADWYIVFLRLLF